MESLFLGLHKKVSFFSGGRKLLQKMQIVLEGLSGQIEISKLCAKYQIAHTHYQWRDQLLKYAKQAFEIKNITKKERYLEQENQKLKRIIGDLTIELKKTNFNYEKSKIC